MIGNQKPQSIYKHTHLDMNSVARLKPLLESSFGAELGNYGGARAGIKQEKIDLLSTENKLKNIEIANSKKQKIYLILLLRPPLPH